jgi:hypothetical protein
VHLRPPKKGSSLNVKELLAEMEDSGLLDRFYENLIDMLAVEVELCYPERIRPGPVYDEVIKQLSMVVRAKGKIHAFYNLNCRRGVVPGARIEGEDAPDAAEFFKGLFQELESQPYIQGRIYEIVQIAGSRVLGCFRNQTGMSAGKPADEKDRIRKHSFADPTLTALSRFSNSL